MKMLAVYFILAAALLPMLGLAGSGASGHITTSDVSIQRVFEDSVQPVGRQPSAEETEDAARFLRSMIDFRDVADLDRGEKFIAVHPSTPYAATISLGLGLAHERFCCYSDALSDFATAFRASKRDGSQIGQQCAARALAHLALLRAKGGDVPGLRFALNQARNRPFTGAATEELHFAREMLARYEHGEGYRECAEDSLRSLALRLRRPLAEGWSLKATNKGPTSLFDLVAAAKTSGIDCYAAHRGKGEQIPIPSIAHMRIGHYVTILGTRAGFLEMSDNTGNDPILVPLSAFQRESTDLFLALGGSRCSRAKDEEARSYVGSGPPDNLDGSRTGPGNPTAHPSCQGDSAQSSEPGPASPQQGLCRYDFQLLVAGLTLFDKPVGYKPIVGPDLTIRVNYNQREITDLPANTTNFGPKWRFNFLSYLFVDSAHPGTYNPIVYTAGGGGESAPLDTPTTTTRAVVHLVSANPLTYSRTLPDGRVEIYSQPITALGAYKYLFLKSLSDPWGNTATINYDTSLGLRISSLQDPFGRKTTFYYGQAGDAFKVTQIKDPFGRSATFGYDAVRLFLKSITDTIGIKSSFTYDANSDFVTSLTTPYGVTTFRSDQQSGVTGRFIEATDADGLKEIADFEGWVWNPDRPKWSYSGSDAHAPSGVDNSHLEDRNTYYFDKRNYVAGYGNGITPNLGLATVYHWHHLTAAHATASGIIAAIKKPLEGRIWFLYAGQPGAAHVDASTITSGPQWTMRTVQKGQFESDLHLEYNEEGMPISEEDPMGRTKAFTYAPNGVDLIEADVTQRVNNVLKAYPILKVQGYVVNGGGASRHRPQTVFDASGGKTTITYDGFGHIATVTNPNGEKTTYVRGLHETIAKILGPHGQVLATYTYDGKDRLSTVTDAKFDSVTYSYDDGDRITRITYPDATFEQIDYTAGQLEPSKITDRQGRATKYTYTPIHQLKTVTDPALRLTSYTWCSCGSLATLTDPAGKVTTWKRDSEGRATAKVFPDGTSQILYSYDPDTGLPSTVTDPLGQVKTYSYNLDGMISGLTYTKAAHSTPTVTLLYDTLLPRPLAILDGSGSTQYTYYPLDFATKGAGRVQKIVKSNGAAPVTYSYDALGSVRSRSLGTALETVNFDELGRVGADTNELGTFTYGYLDSSSTPTSMAGGPTATALSYQLPAQVRRLKSIVNSAAGKTINTFGYSYFPEGAISKWTGAYQDSSTKVNLTFGYDSDDWLSTWTETPEGSTTAWHTNSYSYDSRGNRTSAINPLLDTNYAAANADNQIASLAAKTHGTATTVQTRSFAYDLYGSLTGIISTGAALPASVKCTWDAENRLISYDDGITRSTLDYNAANLLWRLTSTVGGSTRVRYFDWDGMQLVAIREGTATKRFYSQGVRENSGALLYTLKDHLGSVRAVVDKAGAIQAQYQYDPYGVRTTLAGSYASDFGYAGYLNGPVLLAPLRAYDPSTGRWLSRDPIGESGGQNLYAFNRNSAISLRDREGLEAMPPSGTNNLLFGDQIQAAEFAMEMNYDMNFGRFEGGVTCHGGSISKGPFIEAPRNNDPIDTTYGDLLRVTGFMPETGEDEVFFNTIFPSGPLGALGTAFWAGAGGVVSKTVASPSVLGSLVAPDLAGSAEHPAVQVKVPLPAGYSAPHYYR